MVRSLPVVLATLVPSLVLHLTCSGQWQMLPGVPPGDVYSMQALTEQTLWAGTDDAVLRSTNGGDAWTELPITYFGQTVPGPVYDVHFKDALEGYAVGLHSLGDQTVVFRTADGGTSWENVFTNTAGSWPRVTYSIAFPSATVGVTVGTSGKIQRTTNGGTTWYVETSGTTSNLYDVAFSTAANGVAVGANVFLRTTNAGDTWTSQSAAGSLRGVSFSSPFNGFAIGDGNLLYRTTSGGATWELVTPLLLESINFTGVHAVSTTELYATSDQRIWRSTDGGLHWEWYPCTALMKKILFTPGGTGFAVGNSSEIRRTGAVTGPYTPSPYFTLSPTVACEDSVLQCINGSVSGPSFTWLLNGVPFSSTTDASVVLDAPAQSDTIGLVATNGALADTAYRVVQVANTLAISGDVFVLEDTLCSGQSTSVRVASSQSGTSYRLYRAGVALGSAQNGSGLNLNFPVGVITANDTVVLVATRSVSGCGSATASYTLMILMATPFTGFALTPVETELCAGDSTTILLPITSPNTSYRLYIGSTAVGSSFNGTGGAVSLPTGPLTSTTTFNVRATHISGCTSTATATATIEVQDPRAYFTLSQTNPIAGAAVDALNSTSVTGATFLWEFGPGATPQTSTTVSPSGIVFNLGVHDVRLTVTSPAGCTNTRTLRVHGITPPSASNCRAVQGVLDNVNIDIPSVNIHPTTQEVYAIVHATDARRAMFTSGRGDTLMLEMPLIDYPGSNVEFAKSELFVKFSPDLVPIWGVPLHHNSTWSDGGDIAFAADGSVYMVFGHNYYLDSLRIHSSDGSFITIDPAIGPIQNPIMLIKYDQAGRHLWNRPLTQGADKYVLKVATNGDLVLATNNNVRRYSSTGDLLWTYQGFAMDVELAPNGDVWVIGIQSGTVHPLVRLAADGSEQLVAPVIEELPGQTAQVLFNDIEIDATGLLASGTFKGRWVFGPDTLEYYPLPGQNYNSSFVTRFDFQGIPQWAHQTVPNSVVTHVGGALAEGRYHAMFRASGVLALENGTSIDHGIIGNHLFSVDADGSDPTLQLLYSAPAYFSTSGNPKEDLRYDPTTQELCAMMLFADEGPFQMGDLAMAPATPFDRNSNLAIVRGPLDCFTSVVPSTPYSYFVTPEGYCIGDMIALVDASSQTPTAWSWTMPGAVPDMSTEEAPMITYALPGVYTITLTASNGDGAGTTYTTEVLIDVCTGVVERETAGILLAPVPADATLRIDAPAYSGAAYHVVDMTGRVIHQGTLLSSTQLGTSAFPAGWYVLMVDGPTSRQRISFVVAH